jgi:hypothetical protein
MNPYQDYEGATIVLDGLRQNQLDLVESFGRTLHRLSRKIYRILKRA